MHHLDIVILNDKTENVLDVPCRYIHFMLYFFFNLMFKFCVILHNFTMWITRKIDNKLMLGLGYYFLCHS